MNEEQLKLLPPALRKRQEELAEMAQAANPDQIRDADDDEDAIPGRGDWVTTYEVGKRQEFKFIEKNDEGDEVEYLGFATFKSLRLTRLRAGRRSTNKKDPKAPRVLTLDMRINSIGEQIGLVVDGQDILLEPYSSNLPIYEKWRSRPHAISSQCFGASTSSSEELQKFLLSLGPVPGTPGYNAQTGGGERIGITKYPRMRGSQYRADGTPKEIWLYRIDFPMPIIQTGPNKGKNDWAARGVPLVFVDVATPPDVDENGQPNEYVDPVIEGPFTSFYHGVMHAVEALMNTATDAEADEEEILRTMGIQFSLTGQAPDFMGNDGIWRPSHKRVTVNRLAFRTTQGPKIFRLRADEQIPMSAAEQNEVLRAEPAPPREAVPATAGAPAANGAPGAPPTTPASEIDWTDD